MLISDADARNSNGLCREFILSIREIEIDVLTNEIVMRVMKGT